MLSIPALRCRLGCKEEQPLPIEGLFLNWPPTEKHGSKSIIPESICIFKGEECEGENAS